MLVEEFKVGAVIFVGSEMSVLQVWSLQMEFRLTGLELLHCAEVIVL